MHSLRHTDDENRREGSLSVFLRGAFQSAVGRSAGIILLSASVIAFVATGTFAQESVTTHVFDVGAGLCTVTEAPSGNYMVYDVGRWTGPRCVDAIDDVVGGSTIDLLIVSHPDSDHLGEGEHLLARYDVESILRTGYERSEIGNWRELNSAAAMEAFQGASIINLRTFELEPGTEIPLGDVTVTFIAGWGSWDETALDGSDRRNVISIVVRVDYEGRSILFSGDAVGRSPGRQATDDFNPACAHAERIMVERHDAGIVDLSSDVLIAPHHGANNASSSCFIERVDPSHVVFSAGSLHGHPRDSTARRYMDHGVPADSIFRTDRGDDEGGSHGSNEWKTGTQGCRDEPGDDDVQIVLTSDGEVEISYSGPSAMC